MSGVSPHATRILDGTRFVAADVGARGDIPIAWLPLDGLATILSFEPDRDACAELRENYAARGHGHCYQVFDAALGNANEDRVLHVPPWKGAASFFESEHPLKSAYFNRAAYSSAQQVVVRTRHAGEMLEDIGETSVDLMKLDIQGAELEVLESLSHHTLTSLLAVQVEAAMQDRHDGRPRFAEIDAFMLERGFELFDMRPIHVHRALDGSRDNYLVKMLSVHRQSVSVSPRIWEVDALYFKPAEGVAETGDTSALRKLMVCFSLYGFFTEALHTLSTAEKEGLWAADDAAELRKATVDWHRTTRRKWRFGTGRTAAFARWLIGYFGLGEHPQWWPYDHR